MHSLYYEVEDHFLVYQIPKYSTGFWKGCSPTDTSCASQERALQNETGDVWFPGRFFPFWRRVKTTNKASAPNQQKVDSSRISVSKGVQMLDGTGGIHLSLDGSRGQAIKLWAKRLRRFWWAGIIKCINWCWTRQAFLLQLCALS